MVKKYSQLQRSCSKHIGIVHSSPEKITDIYESPLFGTGLFFASSPYSLTSSKYEYRLEPEQLNLTRASYLYLNADEDSKPVAEFATRWGFDNELAFEIICERKNSYDFLDPEIAGEAGWEAQGALLKLAMLHGFDGVSGRDEQGTYWIIDGNAAKAVWQEEQI